MLLTRPLACPISSAEMSSFRDSGLVRVGTNATYPRIHDPPRITAHKDAIASVLVLSSLARRREMLTRLCLLCALVCGAADALRLPSSDAIPRRVPSLIAATAALSSSAAHALAEVSSEVPPMTFEPRGITTEDTVIFVIGCVPFVWAGIEFWRRIAVGDPFGTGSDSVIINDSSGNRPKPVRRVLGQDAIIAARILFALAFASGALVLIAGADVLGR